MLHSYDRSGTRRIDASMVSFVAAGMELAEVLSVLESTLENIAEETAGPMAPPRERTEMTTARSCFREWAGAATRVGWKTFPTPAPVTMRISTIFHVARVRLKRRTKPSPRV